MSAAAAVVWPIPRRTFAARSPFRDVIDPSMAHADQWGGWRKKIFLGQLTQMNDAIKP